MSVIPAAAALAQRKGDLRISVVLPARNEEASVGAIASVIRRDLMDLTSLVDELVVVDDHSTDDTARVATAAGARVVDAATAGPGLGPGKGEALWTSLLATTGDIICWCDADVQDFDGSYVVRLVEALLDEPAAALAKGSYLRPVEIAETNSADVVPEQGGRVTELMARPLIGLFFPELGHIEQPLSGEFAARRSIVERVPFARGYAVDLALLIDVAGLVGADKIVQVDLGERRHDRQPLHALGGQAAVILAMGLARAGIEVPPNFEIEHPRQGPTVVTRGDLPPIVTG